MSRLFGPCCCLPRSRRSPRRLRLSGQRISGTIGPTYAIEEPHLLNAIEQQLRAKEKSGELARLEDEAKQRIVESIEHPRPLPGITRTESARSFYFDPSIVVRENITDAKGNILVPAGTRAESAGGRLALEASALLRRHRREAGRTGARN